LRKEAETDEAFGQLPGGLLSDEFVATVASPEINPADLEKLARGGAKKLDQRGGVGALRGLGGDPKKQLLEGLV